MTKDLRGFWKELLPKPAPKPGREAKHKARRKSRKDRRKEKRGAQDRTSLAAAGVKPVGAPHPDYIADDPFMRSRAWRTLRYAALKNCGGRCQCCGAFGEGVVLHVDHIIPRYKAPHLKMEISNLQCLCEDCNIGKGAHDDTNWRDHFKSI